MKSNAWKCSELGNAVPKAIKARANVLLKEFPNDFSADFEKNKVVINGLDLPFAVTTRNKVAGFIARQIKKKNKQ